MKLIEMTYMEAIRKVIREAMQQDETLFMIGEDIGPYGGEMGLSQGLWQEFGDKRMRDAPISEATIIGCALGASLTGCKAIAEIPFCDFLGECMDQIYNQVAKMRYMFGGKAKIPLVIRTPIGGYQGGAAQHSQCLEAWFNHTPGLKIVMPSNAKDAMGLLRTAIDDINPVMFFEHKKLYHIREEVPADTQYRIPFGQADIKRIGKDLTIIATSYMVNLSLKAAEELAREGYEIEIVDPRTLVPLDVDTMVKSIKKTGRVLIVYEAWKRLGAGTEIAAVLAEKAFNYLKAPIMRIGAENVPIPFSPVLENFVLPNVDKIVKTAKQIM